MRKSCIVQRKNSRLVVLHEDYIEICDGNMIAAMILSILIYWTDVKLAQREQEQEQRKATGEDIPLTSLWIWKSQEGFQHDLLVDKPGMRQVHRSTIATALSLLKDKKFIQARRNPHNNIDRTQQYLVEQDAINEAIKALPDCTIFSTRMSEIVQSNVGNQSMDCTETDNGLPNFRQTIPENTTREYDTENTEQREREVAHATAPAKISSQNDLSEDTEKREAVKASQKEGVHDTSGDNPADIRLRNNDTRAHSHANDPALAKQKENTNAIAQPPAPRKPPANPTIPKRPRPQQQELTDELPATAHSKPVEPHAEMTWGTRKCLQWFDYWRGGVLIVKWKLQQAASCAKGLAEQFDEKTVVEVYGDMAADQYYIDRGGPDVCDVANNIHKYLNKKKPKKEPSNEHKATQQPANAFIERCLDKDYNKKKLEWMREENARRRQAQAEGVQ